MPQYVYSIDDEEYHEIENFEDMLLELCEDSERPKNGDMTVYKAEKVIYTNKSFINMDSILEEISNLAYNVGDDYAETYCLSIERLNQEAKDKITDFISNILDEQVGKPDFFQVKNAIQLKYKDINENT